MMVSMVISMNRMEERKGETETKQEQGDQDEHALFGDKDFLILHCTKVYDCSL